MLTHTTPWHELKVMTEKHATIIPEMNVVGDFKNTTNSFNFSSRLYNETGEITVIFKQSGT